jgi:hypothetical protein
MCSRCFPFPQKIGPNWLRKPKRDAEAETSKRIETCITGIPLISLQIPVTKPLQDKRLFHMVHFPQTKPHQNVLLLIGLLKGSRSKSLIPK